MYLAFDQIWRFALAAIPLALVVAALCRWTPCRPSTRHALWRPSAPIEAAQAFGFVVPDDREHIASEAATHWLNDAKNRIGGDCRIHCAAASAEHLKPGFCSQRMARRNHCLGCHYRRTSSSVLHTLAPISLFLSRIACLSVPAQDARHQVLPYSMFRIGIDGAT